MITLFFNKHDITKMSCPFPLCALNKTEGRHVYLGVVIRVLPHYRTCIRDDGTEFDKYRLSDFMQYFGAVLIQDNISIIIGFRLQVGVPIEHPVSVSILVFGGRQHRVVINRVACGWNRNRTQIPQILCHEVSVAFR